MPSAIAGSLRIELATNVVKFANEMSKASGAVSGFSKNSLSSLMPVVKIGAAVSGAMTVMAGSVLLLGKRGSELDSIASGFDRLAAATGETSDVMLTMTRDATKGLISDLDIMQQANKALLLGLPVTGESLAKLAETAVTLGSAMGLSATKSMDDFTTALGRGSALILDNLGLTVDVTEANESYAAAIGKTADDLTNAEKQTAFYNAAMEAAAIKVEELGGIQLNLGSHLTRVSVIFTNFLDKLSIAIARSPVLTEMMGFLADQLSHTFGTNQQEAIDTTVGFIEELSLALLDVAESAVQAATVVTNFVEKLIGVADTVIAIQKLNPAGFVSSFSKDIAEATGILDLVRENITETTQRTDGFVGVLNRLSNQIVAMRERMLEARDSTEAAGTQIALTGNAARSSGEAARLSAEDWEKFVKKFDDFIIKGPFEKFSFQQAIAIENFKKLKPEVLETSDAVDGPFRIGLIRARQSIEDLHGAMNPPGGFFGGFLGGLKSVIAGMTGGKGLSGLLENIGKGLSEGLGAILSGGLSNAISMGVSLAIKGISKVGSFFKDLFGGPSAAEVAGREAFAAYRDAVVAGLSEGQIAEAAQAGWANQDDAALFIMIRDTFVEIGKSEADAEIAWHALVDAIKEGPEAVQQVISEIEGLREATESLREESITDYSEMEKAAEKYGISLHALGPAFKQAEIGEQASSILSDFQLLEAGGANVEKVLRGMADEVNQFLEDARKFGTDVPDEMRPMLEQMAALGLLTDSSGQQLEDLSSISFEDAASETGDVTEEMEELSDQTGDVLDDLNQMPWDSWARKGIEAAEEVRKKMLELGSSIPKLPGSSKSGTQEIPKLGRGGIVTSPTLAIVGDVPEIITPLAGASSGGQFLDVAGVERRLEQLDADVLGMAQKFAVAMASVMEERI